MLEQHKETMAGLMSANAQLLAELEALRAARG